MDQFRDMKWFCLLCCIGFCVGHVIETGGAGRIHIHFSFQRRHFSRVQCCPLPSFGRNLNIIRTRMSEPLEISPRSAKSSRYSTKSNSFRTEITVGKLMHPPIQLHDTLCLMGSCFAESIGDKLTDFKFQCNVNPFGIIYHPIPLSHSLKNMLQMKNFSNEDSCEN